MAATVNHSVAARLVIMAQRSAMLRKIAVWRHILPATDVSHYCADWARANDGLSGLDTACCLPLSKLYAEGTSKPFCLVK